jgi:hypothetical protein
LQSLTGIPQTASAANPIIAIEITDTEIFEEQDPTGRRTMERQFNVTSSERAATQLDGHENCASDRLLFW